MTKTAIPNLPKIVATGGEPNLKSFFADDDNTNRRKIGIIGGRWTDKAVKAAVEVKGKPFIIDKSAPKDTSAVIGIGGFATLQRAAKAAATLNARLIAISTVPSPVPKECRNAEAVILYGKAVEECGEFSVCDAFGRLAAYPVAIADTKVSEILYNNRGQGSEGAVGKAINKAVEVVENAVDALEKNVYGLPGAAKIIAEANLKLFALETTGLRLNNVAETAATIGCPDDFSDNARNGTKSRLGGNLSTGQGNIFGNDASRSRFTTNRSGDSSFLYGAIYGANDKNRAECAESAEKPAKSAISGGETVFLTSAVLTRFYLSALCEENNAFLPPPSINGRWKALGKVLDVDDAALFRLMNQKEVNHLCLAPRLERYRDDFVRILRHADEINLRCLSLLKQLRFDCGKGLIGKLSPRQLAKGIGFAADLSTDKSLLRALRDAGFTEKLIA